MIWGFFYVFLPKGKMTKPESKSQTRAPLSFEPKSKLKIYVLTAVLTLSLISAGTWQIYHHIHLLRTGKHAIGKIVGYNHADGKEFPVIEFKSEGQFMRFEWNPRLFFHPDVGSEIRFIYDPKNPSDTVIDSENLEFPVLMICIGLLTFFFGQKAWSKKGRRTKT